MSVLSKNCQPFLYRLTMQRYEHFLYIQTFLHFVCKCLKINTLQKKKNLILIYSQKRAKTDGKIGTFEMVRNMALFRILMAFFRVKNIE